MPVRWDNTGRDVFNPVTSSGIIQRLTQGISPLRSPIFRNLNRLNLTAYWPGEDDSGATTIASAVHGSKAAYIVDVTPSTDTELLGANGVLTFNSSTSYMSGSAFDTGSNTGSAQFLCYFRFPTVPVADVELVSVYMTGGSSIAKWTINVTPTTYRLDFYDSSGTSLATANIGHGAGAAPNQWIAMKLDLQTSGGNIAWAIGWYPVGSGTLYGSTGSFAGTVGRIRSFIIWNRSGRDDMKLAHLYISQTVYAFDDASFLGSTNGYVNERAISRLSRLCTEEGVTFLWRGDYLKTETMGRQTAKEFMELIYECVELDGGRLFEPRELIGLAYISRNHLRNRTGPQLNYSTDLVGQLEPTDDDLLIRNDVTVSRPFGSSGRAELTTGRMSTLPATSGGAGRYESEISLNTDTDERTTTLAQYQVQLGTIDESRWSGVKVNLARSALVADSAKSYLIRQLDPGGNLGLTNMPTFLPPNDVDMLVEGIRETISNSSSSREWSFLFNTSPYNPYRINDLTSSANSNYRAGATNSTTAASVSNSALSFTVATPTGALWGTTALKPGNFPLLIEMGGEQILLSGITGTSPPQTFNAITRSVNGIVKSHNSGVSVDVVDRFDATI
jgi:hypothetical protein